MEFNVNDTTEESREDKTERYQYNRFYIVPVRNYDFLIKNGYIDTKPKNDSLLAKIVAKTKLHDKLVAVKWPKICVCCGEPTVQTIREHFKSEWRDYSAILSVVFDFYIPYCQQCQTHVNMWKNPQTKTSILEQLVGEATYNQDAKKLLKNSCSMINRAFFFTPFFYDFTNKIQWGGRMFKYYCPTLLFSNKKFAEEFALLNNNSDIIEYTLDKPVNKIKIYNFPIESEPWKIYRWYFRDNGRKAPWEEK